MNLINYTTTIDLKHHFYAFKKITIFMLWGSEQYFWSEGVSLKTLFFSKKSIGVFYWKTKSIPKTKFRFINNSIQK